MNHMLSLIAIFVVPLAGLAIGADALLLWWRRRYHIRAVRLRLTGKW